VDHKLEVYGNILLEVEREITASANEIEEYSI